MLPKQVIADLRSVLANAQYIVGCLPHDEAHRSSLDQARRAIETVERILKDADGVAGIFAVTDEMAMAFHRATTDGDIGGEDVETIKAGLLAVFAAYGVAGILKGGD